jgi:hypothetical protein
VSDLREPQSAATTMWRLLGVLRTGSPLPNGVKSVRHGGVEAAMTEHDEKRPTRELLREHAELVDQIFQGAPILPARYGVLLERPDLVVDRLLAPNEESLLTSLDEVTEKCEVRVRVTHMREPALLEVIRRDQDLEREVIDLRKAAPDPTNAREISVGQKVAAGLQHLAEEDANAVASTLRPLAHSVTGSGGAQDSETILDASFLVDINTFGSFDGQVGELSRTLGSRTRINAVGPLPPYSFAELLGG